MSCIALRETCPFTCHSVEMRRLDLLLAVTAEVAVAQIICHDEQEIGLAAGRVSQARNADSQSSGAHGAGNHGLAASNSRGGLPVSQDLAFLRFAGLGSCGLGHSSNCRAGSSMAGQDLLGGQGR